MTRIHCLKIALILAALAVSVPCLAQTISVVPATSLPDDPEFIIQIALDAEGETIMGLEISISFDEHVVQLDGIDAGPWFTGLTNEWFFWDYTHAGTELIHFTGSSLGQGVTSSGVIAVCRFTAVQAGISPLDFLGVDVRDAANAKLPADHSSGDSIVIEEAVAAEPSSLAGIKALYR